MENVRFEVQGDQLVIAIDPGYEIGESASGKSVLIATTGGNIPVPVPGCEGLVIGMNVYRPVQVGRKARRAR